MYVPAHFDETRPGAMCELIHQYGFAVLTSAGPDGLVASHLPLLLDETRGAHGVLMGHMARANEQWRHFGSGEVLAIFSGPHAYVSPSWYEARDNVPTWNYVTVHAYGRARLMEGAALRDQLSRMVDHYERQRPLPWSLEGVSPGYLDKLLPAIVGFEIEITRLSCKKKLSQNRTMRDRRSVIEGLRGDGHPDGVAVAEWMEKELP